MVVASVGRGRARVERRLGPANRVEAVLEGLLYHLGVRSVPERDEEALRETELLPDEPGEPEPGRVDLRELLAFTIDPDDARDFDDALSIQREGDGIRVWVHIADVAAAVPPGSALDRDASDRAFSVYVPGRVEPMLAEALSAGLCSLLPSRDRNCVTVELPLGPGLDPGEAVFYRSMIRSRERLTYSQVEAALTGRTPLSSELGEALELASVVAAELRRRRYRRGSLRVETGEVTFTFDGRGSVERAWVETEPLAHGLVEELMILANEAVAGLLAGRRRDALYRVHERPDPQAVELLLSKLEALEVPTPSFEEHLTPADAARLAAQASVDVARYVGGTKRGEVAFPALVLRALKQARYDPRNLGHSGLASRAYCHFTSPIRRYPDLICHRALLNELGVADDPLPEDLAGSAEWCSGREREATHVERAADAICLAFLLERRLFESGWDASFDGEIVGVIGSGIFVRFAEVFEGYVPVRRLPGDFYELDPLGTAQVGRRSGRRYRLGDSIAVTVESVDRSAGKVNLALCEKIAAR